MPLKFDATITKAEWAAACDVDPRTIERIVTRQKVSKVKKPGSNRDEYPISDVFRAWGDHQVNTRIGRKGGELDATHQRSRKDKAQADLAVRRMAVERRTLIKSAEVLEENSLHISAARAVLLLFPSIWSDRIAQVAKTKGPSGVEVVLATAVDEVLTELSRMQVKPARVKRRRVAKKASAKRKTRPRLKAPVNDRP